MFESILPSQDEIILEQERQQSRMYLILFLTEFIILTVFTWIKGYTYIETITSPSSDDFNKYYNKYPLTFDCPCNKTTLEYNKFISYLKVEYHQICLSEFIQRRWINLKFVKSPVRVFFYIWYSISKSNSFSTFINILSYSQSNNWRKSSIIQANKICY